MLFYSYAEELGYQLLTLQDLLKYPLDRQMDSEKKKDKKRYNKTKTKKGRDKC